MSLKRTPLKRTSRLSPVGVAGRRRKARALPEGPLTPGSWREAVWLANGGQCLITGIRLGARSRLWDAHHVIPKHFLPPEHRWHAQLGVVLDRGIHANHTSRFQTIPLESLPAGCMAWAVELGDWAVAALLREHPPA